MVRCPWRTRRASVMAGSKLGKLHFWLSSRFAPAPWVSRLSAGGSSHHGIGEPEHLVAISPFLALILEMRK